MSNHPDGADSTAAERTAAEPVAAEKTVAAEEPVLAEEPTAADTEPVAAVPAADEPAADAPAAEDTEPRLTQAKRPTRPAGDSPVEIGRKPSVAVPFLVYTLARLALFAALFVVFWAVGLGSYPGILFSLLLSMPLSYFLLGKLREPLTERLLARRAQKQAVRAQLRGDQTATSRPA